MPTRRTAILAFGLLCFLFASCHRSPPARTLTISPGLSVTTAADQTIVFTGVRLYKDGRAVFCVSGTLGSVDGSVSTGLTSFNNVPPFADSALRLRFALAKGPVRGNSILSGEPLSVPDSATDRGSAGAPGSLGGFLAGPDAELEKAPAAEYTYSGDTVHLVLTVADGKVILTPAAP